jgi:hypothetical protein
MPGSRPFSCLLRSGCGPSRQAAFFGPTVANGAFRTWSDFRCATICSDCTGFRMPAASELGVHLAGVRKPSRNEPAVGGAPAVRRALSGIDRCT